MPDRRFFPNTLTPSELQTAYRQELDRFTSGLIGEIGAVLSVPPDPGETHAAIEVFPDEQGDGRVSIGMHFHGISPQLGDMSQSLGGSRHFSFGRCVRDMPRIDVQHYQRTISVPDMTVIQIKEWFADCWRKAGGENYPLRVELFGHEDFGDGKAVVLSNGA